jgi:glycosyltransferase involved in cell wall biosynthesis
MSIISRMNVGGPARLLAEIGDGLPQDFDHILVTGRCQPNEIDFLESHPLKNEVVYLDSMRRSFFLLSDFLVLFQLIRLIRKYRPDVVHTHTSKAGMLGRLAAKLSFRGTKIVHTFHGHLLYGYFPKFQLSLIIKIERFLAKFSDILVAVSAQVMRDLKEFDIGLANEWRIIHPGVDIKPLSGAKKLDVLPKDFRVLWIGRFTDIKNPILALQAFSEILRTPSIHVTFTMVGDGELFAQAKELASSLGIVVQFSGWEPNPQRYFANADILLLTSRNEGLPVVVLEAAAAKVPTIATNVGGIADFIQDGHNGLLTKQSVISISSAITKLYFDPALRARLGKAAFETCIRDFTHESYIKKHVALYDRLIRVP